jgi:hypothetical protein
MQADTAFKIHPAEFWITLVLLLATMFLLYSWYSGTRSGRPSGDFRPWSYLETWNFPLLFIWMFIVFWGLGNLVLRRPINISFTSAVRLFLGCAAGGILLFFASYWIVGWQERVWAGRDTLIGPKQSVTGFTPIESRLVDFHRRHLMDVLAEEGEENIVKH